MAFFNTLNRKNTVTAAFGRDAFHAAGILNTIHTFSGLYAPSEAHASQEGSLQAGSVCVRASSRTSSTDLTLSASTPYCFSINSLYSAVKRVSGGLMPAGSTTKPESLLLKFSVRSA